MGGPAAQRKMAARVHVRCVRCPATRMRPARSISNRIWPMASSMHAWVATCLRSPLVCQFQQPGDARRRQVACWIQSLMDSWRRPLLLVLDRLRHVSRASRRVVRVTHMGRSHRLRYALPQMVIHRARTHRALAGMGTCLRTSRQPTLLRGWRTGGAPARPVSRNLRETPPSASTPVATGQKLSAGWSDMRAAPGQIDPHGRACMAYKGTRPRVRHAAVV